MLWLFPPKSLLPLRGAGPGDAREGPGEEGPAPGAPLALAALASSDSAALVLALDVEPTVIDLDRSFPSRCRCRNLGNFVEWLEDVAGGVDDDKELDAVVDD